MERCQELADLKSKLRFAYLAFFRAQAMRTVAGPHGVPAIVQARIAQAEARRALEEHRAAHGCARLINRHNYPALAPAQKQPEDNDNEQ